jgi:hypothetical protein
MTTNESRRDFERRDPEKVRRNCPQVDTLEI